MGDLFFLIKMTIYTFIFVTLMQIKIGSSTLEQKVIHWTHHSTAASYFKDTAQGAVAFLGVQYNNISSKVKKPVMDRFSEAQRPGSRLRHKFQELKESVEEKWGGEDVAEPTEKPATP
ncbi:MAG: hypothetical protein AAF203_10165 [Pseudomonadota bacterium]